MLEIISYALCAMLLVAAIALADSEEIGRKSAAGIAAVAAMVLIYMTYTQGREIESLTQPQIQEQYNYPDIDLNNFTE
jgi:hypothetical protein